MSAPFQSIGIQNDGFVRFFAPHPDTAVFQFSARLVIGVPWSEMAILQQDIIRNFSLRDSVIVESVIDTLGDPAFDTGFFQCISNIQSKIPEQFTTAATVILTEIFPAFFTAARFKRIRRSQCKTTVSGKAGGPASDASCNGTENITINGSIYDSNWQAITM